MSVNEFKEAIINNNIDIIKTNINYNVWSVNESIDLLGHTPLHIAIQNNQLEITDLLIKNGADVNLCDGIFERSALYDAITILNNSIISLLVQNYKVKFQNCLEYSSGSNLFEKIIIDEQNQQMLIIIRNNIRTNLQNNQFIIPLPKSIYNYLQIIRLLLSNGAADNKQKIFLEACRGSILNVIAEFLNWNTDINNINFNLTNSLSTSVVRFIHLYLLFIQKTNEIWNCWYFI